MTATRFTAISGTWRTLAPEVEADVRAAVRELHAEGKGLSVGSALGVDAIAIDEMFRLDRTASKLRIFLPTTLFAYAGRLTAWAAGQDEAARTRVAALLELLGTIRSVNPNALMEGPEIEPEKLEETDYLAMNKLIVELADELMAFQVNQSSGTQDAITRAEAAGKPVAVKHYTV